MENKGFLVQKPGFATVAIHAGQDPDKWKSGAIVPPITLSTMFKQAPEGHTGYKYARSGNPSRYVLEQCLAAVEGAKYAYAYASGLGATTTIASLLNKGDHIVSMDDVYGGTDRLLRQVLTRLGIEVTFADLTKPENLEKAIQDNTKMVWMETPTNPNLKVIDIAETVKIAKKRSSDILVVVDNTFLTCYLQKPLDFGADITMYSMTKYMNGHSDVVLGAAVTNSEDLAKRLKFLQTGEQVLTRLGIEVTFADLTKPENLEKAIQDNTKMVWMETPTNPNLKVIDIAETVKIAKKRSSDILVVVDNTFLTCYLQKPLDFGADITMYSMTKYMNGHSDVVLGAAVTNSEDLAKRLKFLQTAMGIVPSPFDCYLVNRSLKTLSLRMERHRATSLKIAQWLDKHPNVTEVMHPELPSHKQYAISKKQTCGHSGVFSFKHTGELKESRQLLRSLEVFILAESLGGFESLAEVPSIMTHASVPAEQRAALGITDSLVRLSIGLEDAEDLIQDLEQAFTATF